MQFTFRKINSKTLAIMLINKMLYKQNLNFIQEENQKIETLTLSPKSKVSGVFAILQTLAKRNFTLDEKEKIWLVLFEVVDTSIRILNEKEQKMKSIKNRNYALLETLIANHKFMSKDNKFGEIDVLVYTKIYKYFQAQEKYKKIAPKFLEWFERVSVQIQPEKEEIFKQFNIQEGQKQVVVAKSKKEKQELRQENKQQQKEQQKPPQQISQADAAKKKAQPAKQKKEIVIPEEFLLKFRNAKIQRLTKGKEILPVPNKKNILITSALPYVNNVPHLGNIIGSVLSADVFSRYCRLRGHQSIYICGTDEYGTASEMKALEEGLTPKQICDKYNKIHTQVYEWFDIDFDYFGRTTTQQQTQIAQHIFLKLHQNGYLCEGDIEQQYCEKCNFHLADRYIQGTCPNQECKYEKAKGDQCDNCQKLLNPTDLINPVCQICKVTTPKKVMSPHVFIDLPKGQQELDEWVAKTSVEGKWTNNSIKTTESWLKQGLKQRCITRDLKWGTPVPLEKFKDKVFYVWFDAPIGYISITANYTENWKKWWYNPDQVKLYQFMGKDNIPFHTVLFPQSLLGTKENWTLLHHISTTEYLNYEDKKFSKSNKIGVFGDDVQNLEIPSEIWRYYLLTNRPERQDTFFIWEDFQAKNNNELLQNIGNLCNRSLKFAYNSLEQPIPSKFNLDKVDTDFLSQIYKLFFNYVDYLDKVEIKEGLKIAMEISQISNKYMQDNVPWDKKQIESGRSVQIMGVILNALRFISCLFEPYMPSFSAKINLLLGLEQRTERDETMIQYLLNFNKPDVILTLLPATTKLNPPVILIQEYTNEKIEQLKKKFAGVQQHNVI